MATIKKASVKAIEYCQQLTTRTLGKSTTWEQCFDIIMDGFECEVDTHCLKSGDNTMIKLYKKDDATPINVWSIPNSEVFDEKIGDWDWAYIYKLLVEYLVKNLKKLNKGKALKSKKQKEPVKVDVTTLMTRVTELKGAIKNATGSEKKALIKEYNEKSQILQAELEKNAAAAAAKQEAAKASEEELRLLRNKKSALMQRIKEWNAKGKDTTELSAQLSEVTKQLTAARTGLK